jgi:excisionase family DNA binding protein
VLADLLTVPEVMARLHLSRGKVYDLIRRRELTSVTIGRCRRIPESALADYIRRLMEEVA